MAWGGGTCGQRGADAPSGTSLPVLLSNEELEPQRFPLPLHTRPPRVPAHDTHGRSLWAYSRRR